jgi:hypothetical protein
MRVGKKDVMKERSHKFSRLGLGALLTALALVSLVVRAPCLTAQAQTQSRQLDRQADWVKSWPIKTKRWALVIGVDQYRDGQINALKGSVNDAHNLANALVRYAGFPQDQVIVLTTDQPEERQPTRINILTYLSNLASLVPKDGLLLVSFAGHGIERGGQAYLIPSDARLSHDVSLLEESAVSVTRMHDRIKAIGVGQVIVLLDACRNDPGGRADAPNNMSAAYTKFNFDVRNREVQAFATFYATAIGQRAYEYTEKNQGYFTWAIVEALKGAAANDKGEVTLAALVKYVQDNVPKRIAIDLGPGEQQKPFATIEGYRADELVIAISGPNTPGGDAAASERPTDPAAIEVTFWESIKNNNDPADFRAYLAKYPNGHFADLARNRAGMAGSSPANTPTKPKASAEGETSSLRSNEEKLPTSVVVLASVVSQTIDEPAVGQFLIGEKKVVPNPSGTYRRGEAVGVYMQIDLDIDKATIEYALLKDGKELGKQKEDSPAVRGAKVILARLIDTRGLAPGEYAIEIRYRDRVTGKSSVKSAKFLVIP